MRQGNNPTVVGIDVGGIAKGFHAVALSGTEIWGRFMSTDPDKMRDWAHEHEALAIGVDAPCRWSEGCGRAAERALAAAGMRFFATPSMKVAEATPFYCWMLNGARLYRSLADEFPLYARGRSRGRVAFETFPHAIACTLAGRTLAAGRKRSERRAVLEAAGIDTTALPNIDYVDAALCALAAHCFARGDYISYGEPESGLIILPSPRTRAELDCSPASTLVP